MPIPSEEITKNTCPACVGRGHHEDREETATSYVVRHVECWLCKGVGMVGPEQMAEYAKARHFTPPPKE